MQVRAQCNFGCFQMTQNASKTNADAILARSRRIRAPIAKGFASAACAFALSIPLISQEAQAQDWEIITRYDANGWHRVERRIQPKFGGVTEMKRAAPGNNCRVRAFEVVNPKRGDIRCVGYVPPWSQ